MLINIFEIEQYLSDLETYPIAYSNVVAKTKAQLQKIQDQLIARTYACNIRNKSQCFDCGWKLNCKVLQFHHTNSHRKNRQLSRVSHITTMKKELTYGVFLCPNCHALRHCDPLTGQVNFNKIEFR
jgi:predicted RNA-binding Zn-ribbon protein involved in translation (DUF1610 family)